MALVCEHSQNLTDAQLLAFRDLVLRGGQIDPVGLEERIRAASLLVLLSERDVLIATAAIKRPEAYYSRDVFRKANQLTLQERYPFELGWVTVDSGYRGTGISTRVVQAALERGPQARTFATSRSTNEAMHKTLHRFSFKQIGVEYLADDATNKIMLFVRDPE